jgi:hypothetical protein
MMALVWDLESARSWWLVGLDPQTGHTIARRRLYGIDAAAVREVFDPAAEELPRTSYPVTADTAIWAADHAGISVDVNSASWFVERRR